MIRTPNQVLRRGVVVAEFVFVVGLNADSVLRRILLSPAPGAGSVLYASLSVLIGVLALARRRFPERTAALTVTAILLCMLGSAVGILIRPDAQLDGDAETLALVLLVGACCHRLPPRPAIGLALLGGLVGVLSPWLRYGTGATTLTIAVLWAMVWGLGVGVGLILRDSDARHDAALAAARNRERLALARELHDLVAHHITGVVVRTQAAGLDVADGPERDALAEIERSGAEALAAVRRLVTMLRSPEQPMSLSPGRLVETVEAAVDGDDTVTLRLAAGLAELVIAPETVSTAHRVVLESLTNARKHAPDAGQRTVSVEPVTDADQPYLRIEVFNDGLRPGRNRRPRDGYGLVGMGERIAALDGRLIAGEHGDRGWRVVAELPLPGGVVAARPPDAGLAG